MLIENQLVEVKWHPKNKQYYEELGYEYTNRGDVFLVEIKHLSNGSTSKVKIKCDYCGEIYLYVYKKYKQYFEKSPVKKCACKNCIGKKREESNLLTYNVKSPSALKDIRIKIEKTNTEKFGAKTPLQSKEFKEEFDKRFFNKHGVRYPSQLDSSKEKISKSTIESNKNRRIHPIIVNDKKYKGVYSNQQVYIYETIGEGEFNYYFDGYFLDIALLDKKLYIEYDGTGHDLAVRYGKQTNEEFKEKERKRMLHLYSKGWKGLRIKSKTDKFPTKQELYKILEDEIKKVLDNDCLISKTIILDELDLKLHKVKREKENV